MLALRDWICLPGGQRACEDAVGWGETYIFAIDGASGLTGRSVMGAESDAAWFARGVRDGLCGALDAEHQRPTGDILEELLQGLRSEFHSRAGTEVPPDAPSAGIALFREIGDRVEFFGLGDCVGLARLTDGSVACSQDRELSALDGAVIRRMEELHRTTGRPLLDTRELVSEQLLRNRMLRNQPGGYWILDLTGAPCVLNARVCSWPRSCVTGVSVCSDGFFQLVSPFGLLSDGEALQEAMERRTLASLAEELKAAQERDRDGNQYPRLEFRDDLCALTASVV